MGYKVIEIDVGVTSDNEIVLTHRFQPDDEIIFNGRPTLEEFLDIGAPEGETSLSLQSFFQKYSSAGCYFLIDCAHGIEDTVCNWIGKNINPEVRRHLIFQVHTLNMLRNVYNMELFENIHYNGRTKEVFRIIDKFQKYNVHTCSIPDEELLPDNEDLMKIIKSGLHVIGYTINHKRRYKKLDTIGISGVFTDLLLPEDIKNI